MAFNPYFPVNNRFAFVWFLLLWGILCLILNPIGDFPLNDDWSYAYAVKTLTVDGDLEYRGWMSMTLIAHVWWGSLFTSIFGFSFTVLRFSTLILAFVGSLYTFKLFRELRIRESMALLLATVLTLNPIYLNLSFTFMTDVPFYAVSVMSIYYFVRHLNRGSKMAFWQGVGCMIWAILIRQLGLAIPVAMVAMAVLNKRWFWLVPLGIGIAVFTTYQLIIPHVVSDLGRGNEINMLFLNRVTSAPFATLFDAFKRTTIFFIYFGLLFAPILIFLHQPKGKYVDWVWLGLSVIGTFILFRVDFLMPMTKNIIIDFGCGPRTLYDVKVSEQTDLRGALTFSKLQLTFVGMVFGMKVIEGCFLRVFDLRRTSYNLSDSYRFIVWIAVFYAVPIMSVDNFDRYYLLLFPLVIILISNHLTVRRTVWKAVQWVVMMTILCVFTLLGNSYYLSWNRARWEGVNYLINDLNVPTNKIDGGFEYNGWYNYNPDDYYKGVENLWVPDSTYRICFEEQENDGYEVIKEFEYTEWLRMGHKRTIKVMKRKEAADINEHLPQNE